MVVWSLFEKSELLFPVEEAALLGELGCDIAVATCRVLAIRDYGPHVAEDVGMPQPFP